MNYYLSWLSTETKCQSNITSCIKPLMTAYHQYMRTYSGLMSTTPTPLLHATTKFPLLKDKIASASTMSMLKAYSHSNILAHEFQNVYTGKYDGWSPYGTIDQTIHNDIPTNAYQLLSKLTTPKSKHLENIHTC